MEYFLEISWYEEEREYDKAHFPRTSDSVGLEWGLRTSLPRTCPSDAVPGVGTLLGELLL